jgi:hypothetical protein
MTEPLDLKKVADQLGEIEGLLDKLNSQPNTVKAEGVAEATTTPTPSRTILSKADQFALRSELRKKSVGELYAMFDMQAARTDTGIPVAAWAAAGGAAAIAGLNSNPVITKALDSGSGSALIRQDLEPIMLELFVREFPAFDRFPKEPANGLVHAYNQVTSFGDAQFMSELGTVTDDQSTYVRQTTNIAILATRRGVSLKSQFAAVQSGGGFNPENLEMQGGMRAVAHKMQKTIFQGNATYAAGTATDENGAYDPNGFDGLRKILNTARAVNVDPTASTPENMRAAIDIAGLEAMNNGGTASVLYLRPTEKVAFDLQQDDNVRYMNSFVDVAVGVQTNAVNTIFGPLPLAVIPGDSIGEYDTDSTDGSFNGGETVADIYMLDERTITIPYLGSEGPTVLDIPIGISGQLTHLFIIFGMWGLAVKAPIFSNKIRVKQSA